MLKISSRIVFRREPDDSGLLFNADTGRTFMLDPTFAIIWEMLGSGLTETEIEQKLAVRATSPENAQKEIHAFLEM